MHCIALCCMDVKWYYARTRCTFYFCEKIDFYMWCRFVNTKYVFQKYLFNRMFVSNWICKFKFQLIGKSSHEKPKYNLFYYLLSIKISKKGFINGIGNLIWYGVSHRNVRCKLGDIELTNYWAQTSYFWRISKYKIYFTGTYVRNW